MKTVLVQALQLAAQQKTANKIEAERQAMFERPVITVPLALQPSRQPYSACAAQNFLTPIHAPSTFTTQSFTPPATQSFSPQTSSSAVASASVIVKTEDTFFDKAAKLVWVDCHKLIETFPQDQFYWPSYLAAFIVKKGKFQYEKEVRMSFKRGPEKKTAVLLCYFNDSCIACRSRTPGLRDCHGNGEQLCEGG